MSLFHALLSAGGLPVVSAPTQQAYLSSFSLRTETTETFAWTRGNGSFVIVLAKASSAVNADPVDLSVYVANSVFGNGSQIGTGNYVVYIGTGTSVSVTGLTAGTTYHYRVLEFNGSGGNEKYLTLNEKGRLWTSQTAPATGMIGSAKKSSNGYLVRCGGESVYYSNDDGESWTLWFTQTGAAFHSCGLCEGGTIHNASGTPVTRKWLFHDHGGAAKVYAGYTPGDVPETVITGSGSQLWNSGHWNPSTSNYCIISDSGTSRIAILANARTVTYDISIDANSIAYVCATPGANDSTEFIGVFKNPANSGLAAMKRVSGTWTIKATPIGRNYHMCKFVPSLSANGRVCIVSADDTANASLYSDDFMETFTQGNLDGSGHTTGGYGAFDYDETYKVGVAVSRHVNKSIAVTYDFITWAYVTNPGATSVWFDVRAAGSVFTIQASSGGILGGKTSPSNINSAETRYLDYTNYLAEMTEQGFALPSSANQTKIQTLLYALRDNNLWSKLKAAWIADLQSNIDSCRINFVDPNSFLATKAGTITFTEGSGFKSSASGYLQLGWIPSVDGAGLLNNLGVTHKVNEDVGGAMFDYGCSNATSSNRIAINVRDAGNVLNSISMNSSGIAGPANSNAIGRYTNNRIGATAADNDVYKNGSEVDGSSNASVALPAVQMYWGAFNNNGTASLFATRYQGILIIHEGLTAAQVATLHTLINY